MEYEGRATEVELLQQQVDELTWLLNERQKNASLELGSVEYELEQCKEAHAKVRADYEAKLGAAVKENECLQHQLAEAQNSLESYRLTIRDKTERLKQLESYLAQLPTTEEHSEMAKQLSVAQQRTTDLEKQTSKIKDELERLESRLAETMAKLKRSHEREELLQTQLDCAMQRLQIKTPSNGGNPSVDLGLKSTRVTPEFVEDLRFEVDRYRTAFEQAKKLLEAETHRAEGLQRDRKWRNDSLRNNWLDALSDSSFTPYFSTVPFIRSAFFPIVGSFRPSNRCGSKGDNHLSRSSTCVPSVTVTSEENTRPSPSREFPSSTPLLRTTSVSTSAIVKLSLRFTCRSSISNPSQQKQATVSLNCSTKLCVMASVAGATNRINQMAAVLKKSGEPRLCGDPKPFAP
ncbi:hypothetical protein CSKR_203736 [Clonorchis sinensis]|uniref:Uncharacterized protein n=1 Tax=Clonorchis sinensis TaxID=79923 RepID=A0A8T1N1A5_CLOSI|nr:hypothetical protein CSKR_203736 [Clonorchis sinensis]